MILYLLIKKNNFKSYIPISRKNINEFKHNTYKPGFLKQAKEFEMFLNKNKKIFNDLNFAKMVINFCNKINLIIANHIRIGTQSIFFNKIR